MENALHARDKVGVQDFLLLEHYNDQNAFVENLKKRFKENLIYTYIGQVLVSINPYRNLDIYSNEFIELYRNVNLYELPPHIFAISDVAYRLMHEECRPQCILISGESGAGKTEASKKILHYLAAASFHAPKVEHVKDKLLQSNPVLEAFGNAKTNRNDNSSRFGKYMDIEFNHLGAPLGGHINNYLLEKSRVIHQSKGERNFHVFYQLINGADDDTLIRYHLRRDPNSYFYLNQGDCAEVIGIDDAVNYSSVKEALKVFDFTAKEEDAIFYIVSAILHMGNTGFFEEDGRAEIAQYKPIGSICQLLGCSEDSLKQAYTHRSIEARGELVMTPLNRDQAIYARDALAKAVYERLFSWLVSRLNTSLENRNYYERRTLIGLLDIYGFEIFEYNSFEQFCINYCNEKLQQLFIELTLKSEQEEYKREQIEWEPVEYFNNRIICDLIEERHKGIIALLDEECLRPGDASDATFLKKLEAIIGNHQHFSCHSLADNKNRKLISREQFKLIHYAGDVIYNIEGFLDKNNDSLYRDLKKAMVTSDNVILRQIFNETELDSKKRPVTAATQFKNSLSQLMDALVKKEPWYVRCIKPNEYKQKLVFDEKIVTHQVKYLGLMENLRVRRAGFAYRRLYEVFLHRYKSLCPGTWPHYNGDPKDGVQLLVNHLGYTPNEYRMGKTKIFIRAPQTLFKTEDAFQRRKHDLAAKIQAQFRCYRQRKLYQQMREAVTIISSYWRRELAKRLLQRRRNAAHVIRCFIKGFITRNQPEDDCNRSFVRKVRFEWLKRIIKQVPTRVLDKSWPHAPKVCQEASALLRPLNQRMVVRKYVRGISQQWKRQLEEKVIAEELFKDKKTSYKESIPRLFQDKRLNNELESLRLQNFEVKYKSSSETTVYTLEVAKYDRHGYKMRRRVLLLTNSSLYLLNDKDMKPKHKIPYKSISAITTTNLSDGLLIIRIPLELKEDKGDLILDCGKFLIEVVTKIVIFSMEKSLLKIENSGNLTHDLVDGKKGQIEFGKGVMDTIVKRKDGILHVVSA